MKKFFMILLVSSFILSSCNSYESTSNESASSEITESKIESSSRISNIESKEESKTEVNENDLINLDSTSLFDNETYKNNTKYGSLLSLKYRLYSPTINNKVYSFFNSDSYMIVNWVDLEDGSSDRMGLNYFNDESIIDYFYMNNTFTVYTDVAAYIIDSDFYLQLRKEWPQSLQNIENYSVISVDKNLDYVAFSSEDGVSLCEMLPDAEPRLIRKAIPSSENVEVEIPSPIMFLPDDRLYVGVQVWEAIGIFEVIDFNGNVIEKMEYNISGEHSGGYSIGDENTTLFYYLSDSEASYSYDFGEQKLSESYLFEHDEDQKITGLVQDQNNSHIFYASLVTNYYETKNEPQKTTFIKYDLKNETKDEIFSSEYNAILIGVGNNKKILFSSIDNDENLQFSIANI